MIRYFYFLFLSILSFFTVNAQNKGLDLISKMISDGVGMQSMRFELAVKERVKGKYIDSKSLFKVEYSPFKVYVKQAFPNKGMELLYVTGSNKNNVLVNPGGFPWTNINLAPNSYLMRKDIHHSIFDSGFRYVYSIIAHLLEKYASVIDKNVSYDGEITIKGVKCHKITVITPGFKYITYNVKSGEDAHTIAKKYTVNDYMIIDKNPTLKEFKDCEPGMNLKVPAEYAAKMEIYLDQNKLIPFVMKIYDEVGMYEEYEFTNVSVNCKFLPSEFTKDYKDYHF